MTIQYQIAYTEPYCHSSLQTGDIRNNLKFVPSLILICPKYY